MRKRMIQLLVPVIAISALASVTGLENLRADEDSDGAIVAAPRAASPTRGVQMQQDILYAILNNSFTKVKPILEKSCYDCHSAYTHYPWYAKLPLVKGLIESDVSKGRRHVDFTKGFPFTGHDNILEILKNMRTEIGEGDMPPLLYRMMHWGASIKGAQQDSVFNWIDSTSQQIKAFYDREKIPYEKEK